MCFTASFMEKIFPHLLLHSPESMEELTKYKKPTNYSKKKTSISYEAYQKKYEEIKNQKRQEFESQKNQL